MLRTYQIDANERRCDILPLAEGRNSLDLGSNRAMAANDDAWPASPTGSGSGRQ